VTSAEIGERAQDLRRRIARACERSGRGPDSVRLVAVTKTHPASLVREAIAAGLDDFGENRVQEAAAKIEAIAAEHPGVTWRFIGHLQTNKAKSALKWFDEIQSVDRRDLLERVAREAAGRPTPYPILLEINVGAERSKSGAAPESAAGLLREALGSPSLAVRGLMAVPPFREDAERARPDFRALAALRERLRDETGAELPELSMGMSHDFEIAVEEGATIVRVGTALFGPRETP
jgi:pyridoxal phosphate enzyme (YggS family)